VSAVHRRHPKKGALVLVAISVVGGFLILTTIVVVAWWWHDAHAHAKWEARGRKRLGEIDPEVGRALDEALTREMTSGPGWPE